MNRKLRKFLRDPVLFFKDMYLKRTRRLRTLVPKKMLGYQQYTVVSAVYNVGSYLDEYFASLVEQRLDFRNNIRVVMVDDGSIDNSPEVIKRWQRRYPENIVYLRKENGGQASARNFGLDYVEMEWVTFIDPDDFIDLTYFLDVDTYLKANQAKNLQLVSCNFIFFHEGRNQFSDTHPLKYRFAKRDVTLPCSDLGKHVQLSVNSAFFKTDVIRRNKLLFDPRIRPNFEDAHFVGRYLSFIENGHVGFSSKAKYFYRKRSDGSSTLDRSWQKASLFEDVLCYGCLDLFELYIRQSGSVPKHIQRTVFYHVFWYFKRLVNKPELVAFLDDKQQARFLQLLDSLFAFIDADTVLSFELAGCWFMHKVGILGAFKRVSPSMQIAYLEGYDPIKSQLLIRYFTAASGFEAFLIGGQDVIPDFAKTIRHDFLDRTFVLERRVWLPLPRGAGAEILGVRIGSLEARISVSGSGVLHQPTLSAIRKHYGSQARRESFVQPDAGAWLLMDRDTQADDNAEHLYRYIRREHPEQKSFFVLRREAHDWGRLEREGFDLLAFGSARHEAALRSCSKIISSHIDQYVVDYFKDKSLRGKQFVFLQHGVTQADLSAWLNEKRIDCFVTAAQLEFQSIAGDGSRYKFTRKEVILAGLARHDALLQMTHSTERIILIMPTWRKQLTGPAKSGNQRALIPDFMSTDYAQAWKSVLESARLSELARKFGFRLVFFPHANIQPYVPLFGLPASVEVLGHTATAMQELFAKAAVMITDYSSVAFEMAFLKKPIIYYQFDETAFFQAGHIAQKGFFDYRADGFGAVTTTEEDLLDSLEHLLAQDAQPEPQYLARMDAFFPFRDGRNCERIYQAIVALDQPMPEGLVDMGIVQTCAETASRNQQWILAEGRWRRLLQFSAGRGSREQELNARLELATALRRQGKLLEAQRVLRATGLVDASLKTGGELVKRVTGEQAALCMARGEWDPAVLLWSQIDESRTVLISKYRCLAEAGRSVELHDAIGRDNVDCQEKLEERVLLALAQRDWAELVNLLEDDGCSAQLMCHRWLCLLLARAYRESGMFSQARAKLVTYESSGGPDHELAVESARLFLSEGCWDDALRHLAAAYPEGIAAMPLVDALGHVRALRRSGDIQAAQLDIGVLASGHPPCSEICQEKAELASLSENWTEAASEWRQLCGVLEEAPYRLAMALRHMGEIDAALSLLRPNSTYRPKSADQWQLLAEIAELAGDYLLAAESWHVVLSHYPNMAPEFAWDRRNFAILLATVTQVPATDRIGAPPDETSQRFSSLSGKLE